MARVDKPARIYEFTGARTDLQHPDPHRKLQLRYRGFPTGPAGKRADALRCERDTAAQRRDPTSLGLVCSRSHSEMTRLARLNRQACPGPSTASPDPSVRNHTIDGVGEIPDYCPGGR